MVGTLTNCRNIVSVSYLSSLSYFVWVLWHSFRTYALLSIRVKIRNFYLFVFDKMSGISDILYLRQLILCGFILLVGINAMWMTLMPRFILKYAALCVDV